MKTPCICHALVENFRDALRAQDNLSKLLTALSTIAAPSSKFVHIFGKGADARGGDCEEPGKQLFNKSATGTESAVMKKIKKFV